MARMHYVESEPYTLERCKYIDTEYGTEVFMFELTDSEDNVLFEIEQSKFLAAIGELQYLCSTMEAGNE